jgi:hypothetical protein
MNPRSYSLYPTPALIVEREEQEKIVSFKAKR